MTCFVAQTRIATEHGEVAIEDLRPGDRVLTRDNGLQLVRWVGIKPMSGRFLLDHPHLRPVLVSQDAFGEGLPRRDMMVTPNCRVPFSLPAKGVLNRVVEERIAFKNLVNHRTVQQIDTTGITYVHLVLGRHEVISANGVWVETFKASDTSANPEGNAQRLEIFEIFPEIAERCAREKKRAENNRTTGKTHILRRFL